MSARHNLIIDTDVGSDDACTIAFALADSMKNPDRVKVHALTTVFGNVSCFQSVLNVYSLLQLYGQIDVKIYPGATTALAYVYSSQWTGHGVRGMGKWPNPEEDVHSAVQFYAKVGLTGQTGADQPQLDIFPHSYLDTNPTPITLEAKLMGLNHDNIGQYSETVQDLYQTAQTRSHTITRGFDDYHNVVTNWDGVNLPFCPSSDKFMNDPQFFAAAHLVSMVNAQPKFYDLLCLGPLTNIALALEIDSLFLSKLRSFSWLGGGFVGNCTPYAEFNAYSDSLAAKIVLERLRLTEHVGVGTHTAPAQTTTDGNIADTTPLQAVIVGWDACLSCGYNLNEFKHLFGQSVNFSWERMMERFNQWALDNNSNKTDTATSSLTLSPSSLSSIQFLQNDPIYRFLTVYTCRQFFSNYEAIVEEAVNSQRDYLSGVHSHTNSYCDSKSHHPATTADQDENDPKNGPNSIPIPAPTRSTVSKLYTSEYNTDTSLTPSLTSSTPPEEKLIQPAQFILCDLYAYMALVYPETIGKSISGTYSCLSDVSSPQNGKIIPSQEHDTPPTQVYDLQYVTVMDKDVVTRLITDVTHCGDLPNTK